MEKAMRYDLNIQPETFELSPELGEFELSSATAGWQHEQARGNAAYIRWVQGSLNRILGLRLTVDGVMGPGTRSAVRAFQQRSKLAADGLVGPRTEAVLIAAGAGQPPHGARPAPTPTPPPGPSGASRPCPVTAPGSATLRCLTPGKLACPAIPDLLCVSNVSGIPFEYPTRIARAAGGLQAVTQRRTVTQRFIPSVGAAIAGFIARLGSVGMPVEAILTYGSLYCRCMRGTDSLSNHAFGDAIDVVGVRWRTASGPRETIVHNYTNAGERQILRRINGCLRLSFATVIDYHRADHRDHFHCDMNRGRGRNPTGKTTIVFVQEALKAILGLSLAETGQLDPATYRALAQFSGRSVAELQNKTVLNQVMNDLFARIAQP